MAEIPRYEGNAQGGLYEGSMGRQASAQDFEAGKAPLGDLGQKIYKAGEQLHKIIGFNESMKAQTELDKQISDIKLRADKDPDLSKTWQSYQNEINQAVGNAGRNISHRDMSMQFRNSAQSLGASSVFSIQKMARDKEVDSAMANTRVKESDFKKLYLSGQQEQALAGMKDTYHTLWRNGIISEDAYQKVVVDDAFAKEWRKEKVLLDAEKIDPKTINDTTENGKTSLENLLDSVPTDISPVERESLQKSILNTVDFKVKQLDKKWKNDGFENFKEDLNTVLNGGHVSLASIDKKVAIFEAKGEQDGKFVGYSPEMANRLKQVIDPTKKEFTAEEKSRMKNEIFIMGPEILKRAGSTPQEELITFVGYATMANRAGALPEGAYKKYLNNIVRVIGRKDRDKMVNGIIGSAISRISDSVERKKMESKMRGGWFKSGTAYKEFDQNKHLILSTIFDKAANKLSRTQSLSGDDVKQITDSVLRDFAVYDNADLMGKETHNYSVNLKGGLNFAFDGATPNVKDTPLAQKTSNGKV